MNVACLLEHSAFVCCLGKLRGRLAEGISYPLVRLNGGGFAVPPYEVNRILQYR
jgi:hypothetical protein